MSTAIACVRDGAGFAEVVVPRPVDVVFDYVTDLCHLPIWWPTHQVYRRLAGDGGLRTVYAFIMARSPLPFGLPLAGITIVTACEPPTQFSYRILSPGLLSRMHYSFAAVPGGTRISLEVPSALPGFAGHVAPAFDALAATLQGSSSLG